MSITDEELTIKFSTLNATAKKVRVYLGDFELSCVQEVSCIRLNPHYPDIAKWSVTILHPASLSAESVLYEDVCQTMTRLRKSGFEHDGVYREKTLTYEKTGEPSWANLEFNLKLYL